MKKNLPAMFYVFGVLGVINAGTKNLSDGIYSSGLINQILFYPFSFLPLSSLSFFIISGILDLSIIWLVLGYFLQQKNKSTELNKPSAGYKVAKWLLIGLATLFVLIVLWGMINFIKNV